ncbi:MAG: terminase gpP N-terminus-related DNA-binding protein [Cetobacterium sp.]
MDFELEGFNELELGADIAPAPVSDMKKIVRANAVDPKIISKARALYISANMSIPKIAKEVGVSEHTIADYCKKEKWTLYRSAPDLMEWSEEMFDDIYGNITFYDRAKEVLVSMLEVEAFQSPKDIKAIIESFRIAEERTTSLRLVRENAGVLDGE